MRVLLSPLTSETGAHWYGRVSRELSALLGADAASLMVAAGGTPVLYGSGIGEAAQREYERYYWALDVGLRVRRKALGVEVWSRRMLWDRAVLYRSEYYNDFIIPNRLYDAVGVTTETGPDELAGVSFYHGRRGGARFGSHACALLRVILPAFRAGAYAWLRFGGLGRELPGVLDALDKALLLCDADGRVLHANHRLGQILDLEPERERLRRELGRLGDALGRLGRHGAGGGGWQPDQPVVGSVRTARGDYRLRGSYIAGASGAAHCILLVVEPKMRELPSDDVLQARYDLTPRQAAVARLLARGLSNAAIADALWISPHTARHHTETILLKLGVHSRAEVAPLLLWYG